MLFSPMFETFHFVPRFIRRYHQLWRETMRLPYLYRVLAILFAICLALPVHAQFAQRGSINGIVTDPSGALAADARVTLTDLQRNQTSATATDSSGHYVFSQL